ncbi:MAG: DUF4401 domain-containing protein [Thalassobaculum sp.]|uniref:DUF4401 domain-containing protein n=1 Tax=Thalassobaculum sp. TaxID=2022740 RepID=UPI0032ECD79B
MADDALDRLCAQFGVAPAAARAAVAAASGADSPWYLRVATAIGAWMTAGAMILAVGLAILPAFDNENLPLTAAGIGAAILAGAIALRRGSRGEFGSQVAVAGALAGQALVVGGIGIELEDMAAAAVVSLAVTALLVALIRDQELQFLSAAGTVAVAFLALLEREVPQAAGVLAAVTLPVAIGLLVRPPAGVDLRGLGWALLLVPLMAMSVPGVGGLNADWLPRAAYAAGLVAVLAMVWQATAPDRRMVVLAGGAIAVLVGTVAAAGIAGSLMLLSFAYLLGSRMLAALGAAAHVWFVSRFYYDLDITLLDKSGMLTATGLLLLGLWWLWTRSGEPDAGHD